MHMHPLLMHASNLVETVWGWIAFQTRRSCVHVLLDMQFVIRLLTDFSEMPLDKRVLEYMCLDKEMQIIGCLYQLLLRKYFDQVAVQQDDLIKRAQARRSHGEMHSTCAKV